MLRGKDHVFQDGIHPKGWNPDWQKWIDGQQGKKITKEMIDKQLQKMMKSQKYSGYFRRQVGKKAVVCYQQWQKLAAECAAKKAAEKAAKEAAEKAAKEVAEKAAKEASQRGVRALAKKGAKKVAGAAARKVPFLAVGFFAYDWWNGGLGHAVNEATWPVSEAWRSDGMLR